MTDKKLITDKTSETHVCYCPVIPYYLKAGMSLSFESSVCSLILHTHSKHVTFWLNSINNRQSSHFRVSENCLPLTADNVHGQIFEATYFHTKCRLLFN